MVAKYLRKPRVQSAPKRLHVVVGESRFGQLVVREVKFGDVLVCECSCGAVVERTPATLVIKKYQACEACRREYVLDVLESKREERKKDRRCLRSIS